MKSKNSLKYSKYPDNSAEKTYHNYSLIFSILSFIFFLCLMLSARSGYSQGVEPLMENHTKILFVGNEKVGSEGGLYNHFRRSVAGAKPPLEVETDWISMYGMPALQFMYTDKLVNRVRTGNDDLLVVQSGSDSAMQLFAGLSKESGKKIVFFEAWAENPLLDPLGMTGFRENTEKITLQMQHFQQRTGISVIPCGWIWYDLLAHPVPFKGLRRDYLFVPGSSVQNDLGTLVNVSAVYAVTTGKSPVGLPFWTAFPEELVTEVQERVWQLVGEWAKGTATLGPVPAEFKVPSWPAMVKDGDRILYIGNSFIGTEGGLDNYFRRMVPLMDPPLSVQTRSVIYWGQGLPRMYTDSVLGLIGGRENDIVVVTSGPVELLKKFRDTIVASGSKMMVHMTWGRNPEINPGGMASFRKQTMEISDNMMAFEKETGVPVAPCGLVFYDLIVDPPDCPGLRKGWVFMMENIHQNHIGTMVNASVHYAVMTGRSPVGLQMWDPYPPELVKAVQERAWEIVKKWKKGIIDLKPLSGN